ncbi:MAG: hypothetical protein GXO83_00735 [Chlorobi bacterium]|nr:hypothetical protein [Chlorobiota bacterium]
MKTKILLFALFTAAIAVAFQSCKQGQQKVKEEEGEELQVPEAVTTAFRAKFANAGETEWGMEEDSSYEAEFKLNDKEMSASFDKAGTWLETEYCIADSLLPAAIVDSVKILFDSAVIKKAEVSETPQGKFYELELKTGEKETEAVFDENGWLKVLKKEQMKEEEEGEEGHAEKAEHEENEEHEGGGEK